ncbi:PAS domain-containing protein [Solicola sp. PLA-1-18]|uniref:PAS domain-containing protein n=1 Tax=Solicola sp. PLA-1-18 TaxID=3380532 RepID=UPI003B7B975A
MRGEAERNIRAVTHGKDVPAGGFRYEIEADRWTLSDDTRSMLGLGPDEAVTADVLTAFQHPEDRATMAAVMDSITGGRSYQHFYRVVTRTGKTLSVLGVGQVVDGDQGQGRIVVGYLIDLTPASHRNELDRAFAAVVADFDHVDPVQHKLDVLSCARGLLMGILDVSGDGAYDLLREAAVRGHSTEVVIAEQVVLHFSRTSGIHRSRSQMRHEVQDVLDQD